VTLSEQTDSIPELIKNQRRGWALDQAFYADPDIFERDVQRIFMRHWIFAGHVSRIPEGGDFFVFTVAGEQILVSRTNNGDIHAMFNVCRHRGSRVCSEAEGNASCHICPYHGWTYGTDGSLLVAKTLPADLDKADFSMPPCHVRVLEGLIFVNLAEEPEPFDEVMRDGAAFLEPHGLSDTKVIRRQSWHLNANWKLVWENYNECYHCHHAHPQFCAVTAEGLPASSDSERVGQAYQEYERKWQLETEERGRRAIPIEWDGRQVHFCFRMPLKPDVVTHSEDGSRVAPFIGEMTEQDNGLTALITFPGFGVQAYCDYAVAFRFTPLDVQLTEIEATWLVNRDAVEGVDYDIDRVSYLWSVTTAQDKVIVDANQAGVNSRRYQPGPYVAAEQKLNHFVEWYLQQLR